MNEIFFPQVFKTTCNFLFATYRYMYECFENKKKLTKNKGMTSVISSLVRIYKGKYLTRILNVVSFVKYELSIFR